MKLKGLKNIFIVQILILFCGFHSIAGTTDQFKEGFSNTLIQSSGASSFSLTDEAEGGIKVEKHVFHSINFVLDLRTIESSEEEEERLHFLKSHKKKVQSALNLLDQCVLFIPCFNKNFLKNTYTHHIARSEQRTILFQVFRI